MDWEETVMKREQLTKINDAMPSDAKYGDVFEKIAREQAQITWQAREPEIAEAHKAGYEQGLKEQGSPRADAEIRLADEEYAKKYRKEWVKDSRTIVPYKAGKLAGIREVVEWIKANSPEGNQYYHTLLFPKLFIDKRDWQAFLKEKGIGE